jgi:hypothetical protein
MWNCKGNNFLLNLKPKRIDFQELVILLSTRGIAGSDIWFMSLARWIICTFSIQTQIYCVDHSAKEFFLI